MKRSRRTNWHNMLIAVGVGILLAPWARADDVKEPAKPAEDKKPRRVYVLHSGLHTILADPVKNIAAQSIKEGLHKRGVDLKDLVALDNPFPDATWKSLLPYEGGIMFLDSVEPGSKMSQDSYLRLHKALDAQGVTGRDNLVWIGHSAGGQIGLTMANLARNLARYPALAKDATAYKFDMVITLGTPVGSAQVPADVKLRHYYSTDDKVVRWASKVGPWVAFGLGYRMRIGKFAAELGENCIIRCFGEIEHPNWDVEERVLDRIVGEGTPDY